MVDVSSRGQLRLIGQYDSPFVRRVAIAMARYGLAYEHVPWSVWADADALAAVNPLRRVPTLVLEEGTALIESFAILDYLDDRVGVEAALLPRSGPVRHAGLRVAALATGVADKAVSLLYEGVLRKAPAHSQVWAERCKAQISATLALLERERAALSTPYWFGDRLSHADVAVACALRFGREAHPALIEPVLGPALREHAARCEALPDFQRISQPLTVAV
jgi:glutathione S-transferase